MNGETESALSLVSRRRGAPDWPGYVLRRAPRDCSRYFKLGLLLLFGFTQHAAAQSTLRDEDLRVMQDAPAEQREMLFNFLLNQAELATRKRLDRLNAIKSEADFKAWQEANRSKFLELIGGLPMPANVSRPALNARVVGEFAREGYVVRKVIFESLPENYVTANLYVPSAGKPPYPAVLCPLGHAANGKAYEVYQRLFIGLAKRGYVVLAYDPVGQGERFQYWDFLANRRLFEFNEHEAPGIQEYLLGQSFARYRIWDGLRGIDFLTSLPEVDASRIAATGSSGGGTLTTFIAMLDPRLRVVSIVTYITSLPKKIENRINDAEGDPEQDIQGLLAAGIDHTEMVGMIAPRPVQIGSARRDFFPIEGTRQTFAEVEALYKKLGLPERVRMVDFDQKHMYSQALREATTAWFDRWLKGADTAAHEPEITPEKGATLQCTPTGEVITSLGGKTLFDYNRAEANRLAQILEERRRQPDFQKGLTAKIRERLGLRPQVLIPGVQKAGEVNVGDIRIEKLRLETEPGIVVPLRLLIPKESSGPLPAVIYLRDRAGAASDLEAIERVARQNLVVAVADVRGFGETMSAKTVPDPRVDYFDPRDGMDADFTYASFFLGRPLIGMRVADALGVARYLSSRPEIRPDRIAIAGRGWAGLIAAFVAALDASISAVAVEDLPATYDEVAHTRIYQQPVSLMAPAVLRDFDLPDVLTAISPRPLLVLNPTDAQTQKMTRAEAQAALHRVAQRYDVAPRNSPSLKVEVLPFESDVSSELAQWLGQLPR